MLTLYHLEDHLKDDQSLRVMCTVLKVFALAAHKVQAFLSLSFGTGMLTEGNAV